MASNEPDGTPPPSGPGAERVLGPAPGAEPDPHGAVEIHSDGLSEDDRTGYLSLDQPRFDLEDDIVERKV